MKILLDNGHGVNTAGKRSPDGRLREFAYTRDIAARLEQKLRGAGFDVQRIVPEEFDVSLSERCRRVNEVVRKAPRSRDVLLVSIHCNAAASSGWQKARGWSVYVSLNASQNSRILASHLEAAARQQGLTIRRPSPAQPWHVKNLAMCRDTNCPAVLTENLFQDNLEDVEFLLSERGRQAIVDLHFNGIINYIKDIEK